MTPFVSALMGFFILPGGFGFAPVAFAESVPALPSYQVSLTAYNAVPGQTDSDPLTTASGAYSNPNIVAARSVDLADELPFGTVIAIEPSDTSSPNCGYPLIAEKVGLRVIADSMNSRIENTVDVLFGKNDSVKVGGILVNSARTLGICDDVTIEVVGHIDIADIPHTQTELVQLLASDSHALAAAK